MERKRKPTGPRTKYPRYSGPVRTSYRSPQTIKTLRRSAFSLPLPDSSPFSHYNLLSQHMHAHYRRLAGAQSRTDTCVPASLLKCTKVLDQAKKQKKADQWSGTPTTYSSQSSLCSRRNTADWTSSRQPFLSRTTSRYALTSTPKPGPESDAGFVSMTQSLTSLHLLEVEPPSVKKAHNFEADNGFVGGSGYDNTTHQHYDMPPSSVPMAMPTHLASPRQDYRHVLDSPLDPDSKWQLYHTKTGQLTGYMKSKKRHVPSEDLHNVSPIPWKPAFTSDSSVSYFAGNGHFLRQSSSKQIKVAVSSKLRSCGKERETSQGGPSQGDLEKDVDIPKVEAVVLAGSEVKGDGRLLGTRTVLSPSEPVTATSVCHSKENTDTNLQLLATCKGTRGGEGRWAVREGASSLNAGETGKPITTAATELSAASLEASLTLGLHSRPREGPEKCHDVVATAESFPSVEQRGREVIGASAALNQQSLVIQKRSQEAKERVEEKFRESEYLRFISGVTRDILERGILSESALALLFKAHVEKNRHQLREDVMWEKIELLKKELGINK